GIPCSLMPKSSTWLKENDWVFGSQTPAHSVASNILVMCTTGGLAFGANMTSTGAALAGDGFNETLCVDSTFPVLASNTVTESPACAISSGLTVLVTRTRSMPLCIAMPCGYRIEAGA